mmetsp:Transcript_51845/g.150606  ORF Transcript_51845/g.150606 Transcript_51845/m.150606 type:complete len:276 (+) Transcript_51845:1-828(+)
MEKYKTSLQQPYGVMTPVLAADETDLEVPDPSDSEVLPTRRGWLRPLLAGAVALIAAASAAVVLSLPRAAGREMGGGDVELAEARAPVCSAAGDNCLKTGCCADQHLGCFKKDTDFATCHPGCIKGQEDPRDPAGFRTPWDCTLLGPKPKPRPAPAAPLPPANAGCLVQDDGKVLVVRHSWGALDIPGGTADGAEPPDQTATRETFEETGYRAVAAGLKEVRPNGFHIFNCTLQPPYHPVGAPDPHEVAEVIWLPKPQLWSAGVWRFPDEVASLL